MKSTLALIALVAPIVLAQQPLYAQCGGNNYSGSKTCVSGATCKYTNEWYSQCVPGSSTGGGNTNPSPATSPKTSPSSGGNNGGNNGGSSGGSSGSINGFVNPTKSSRVSFPVDVCSRSGCQTLNTGLISATGSWDLNAGEFYQYGSRGLLMNKPLSRVYVTNPQGNAHQQFYLKNRQISIDVNVAGVPCGYNVAFYFSEMQANAPLGGGYCDAQDATSSKPACNEMDIFEGNIGANSLSTHACNKLGGVGTSCDPWGCTVNTFNNGYMSNVGPGAYIDTTKTYTITTAFYTNDGTDNGVLSSVKQTFKQNGKQWSSPTETVSSCQSGKYWSSSTGFTGMSKAFDKGMTMILSYWGGNGEDMSWLDGGSGKNSACSRNTGTKQGFIMNARIEPIS
ncbi:hypothetical protein HK098_002827 [Nowakowskiella sp. JEL0407]|nr:hypothetical protein HK098_002827 [Nowakowskiella sp. JEL0407]